MTYEEAKAHKQKLDEVSSEHSKALNSFERSSNGMTPDHVRETPEWKEANRTFEQSFKELRNFNGWFVKNFRKNQVAERRNKYNQK